MAEALEPALPPNIDALANNVLSEACDRGLKLVTVESCTGGLLASLLTDIPGRSHAFERGFVTYTDEAKSELVGVSPGLLETHGAVSEPVARAMAEGALARSRGDIAVAITGFAGEAGPGDEVGRVHFASARTGRPTRHREEHFGDIGRAAIRLACLEAALEMMLQRLNSAD